ncbi:MAG: PQQ-binding-like beta-propeller repeat protein [Planctomycetota bacterium]
MNCGIAEKHLSDLALGILSGETRSGVEAHVAECVICQVEFDRLREILREAERVAEREVPADFRDRLGVAVAGEIARVRGSHHRNRIFRRWIAVAAMILLLVGAGMMHLRRTTPPAPAASSESVIAHPLEAVWRARAEGYAAGRFSHVPVVAGERVFGVRMAGGRERIFARDARTGGELWISGESSGGFLSADGERVYAMRREAGREILTAYRGGDGGRLWEGEVGSVTGGTWHPVVCGNVVVVGNGGILAAYDAVTGAELWRTDGAGPRSRPAQTCGALNYVTAGGVLRSVESRTGAVRWETPIPADDAGRRQYAVTASGGRVFVLPVDGGTGDRRLAAFDGVTGRFLWERRTVAGIHLAATGDFVFVKGMDLEAFRAADGASLWRKSFGNCAPVTCGRDVIYAVRTSGRDSEVAAVDPRSGGIRWTQQVSKTCAGILLADNHAFLEGLDGILYAFAFRPRGGII